MKLTITDHPYADWFFPKMSLRVVRGFRTLLGLVTLGTALLWLPNVHAFFTDDGIATAAFVKSTSPYSHLSIFFLSSAPWFVYTCYALFILALLGMIFGKGGRLSSIVAWLMFISCASRFPLVFYGAIDVLHFLLFFNMFHDREGYAPWWQGGVAERSRLVTAWAMRMIQVSLCIVYASAAIQKVRYDTWFNGTEVFSSLQTRYGVTDFGWLKDWPVLVNIMSYAGWMIEMGFAFLVWSPGPRRTMLFLIYGLHFNVLLTMNATLFSFVMFVALLSFFEPGDETRIGAIWDKWHGKFLATRAKRLASRAA